MEQGTTSSNRTLKLSDKKRIVRDFDLWTFSLYRKQKRIVIETLDYHAGPLVMTRDELCEIARIMGLHVRKRKPKKKKRNSVGG